MFTLPLNSPDCQLDKAGGKGVNLMRLIQAGFPVPGGFIVTTGAYRSFLEANDLQRLIDSTLLGWSADDPSGPELASRVIRAAFASGVMPPEIAEEIRVVYAAMKAPAVAVRSSATTEDLPNLSFAGQQDTFLNVIGADEVLVHVALCWASLWTARAIGYRTRNQVDHRQVALAVAVQEMVQSDVSGVLFTANPLSGLLSETVIDATIGLGEALVSGQVEPDQYVINNLTGEIIRRRPGAKQAVTRSRAGGGVATSFENHAGRFTLTDEQVRQLSAVGQRVQQELRSPQDIEWALFEARLYLLQSRPITSLFPIPETSFDPLIVWFSFGAVQGLLGPITPLGQDGIRQVAAGAGRMFGVRVDPEKVNLFAPAGERIWVRVSDVIRNPIGSRLLAGLLDFVEPSINQILQSLFPDPRLGAGAGKIKFTTIRRIGHFALPILPRMLVNLVRPEKGREKFEAAIVERLDMAQIQPGKDRYERLANTTSFIRLQVANAFPFLLPKFIPLFGPAMAMLNLLLKIGGDKALEVTRGLPENVTIEMDLALWQAAKKIQADPDSGQVFRSKNAQALASSYLAGELPEPAQSAAEQFLSQYGMRGVAEIDIGQPRWREDPTPVMHSLQSYLEIRPEAAPDLLYERGRQAAQAAVEELAQMARRQRGGWMKERMVRFAARRVRALMGVRESPKFFAIRLMGIARQALLEAGSEFAAVGDIEQADDLFFLRLSELDALARAEARDWKALVAERRIIFQRELLRRQSPRLLISDGRAFYEGIGASASSGDALTGSPVSPGVVEGLVRIVLDPHSSHLAPGEILVCPGTDPAWTPLFMAAAGLITEVGGMMTHGSVVAREYGIPAVVGVHQATQRLKDGQKIRLNGASGEILILES